MGLVSEVQRLKKLNADQAKKITILEDRVSDMEQYSRMNDLVINGLKTKHRTYARAAAAAAEETAGGSTEPSTAESETLEQQVLEYLESKDITVARRDSIEACHILPSKIKGAIPAIIIRFTNRKDKNALLKQASNLKGSKVYINEHLTKKNAAIAKRARALSMAKKIEWTWTWNCKVFIKQLGSTPEQQKISIIRDISELDKYDDEETQD